jgi:hypothetical protein
MYIHAHIHAYTHKHTCIYTHTMRLDTHGRHDQNANIHVASSSPTLIDSVHKIGYSHTGILFAHIRDPPALPELTESPVFPVSLAHLVGWPENLLTSDINLFLQTHTSLGCTHALVCVCVCKYIYIYIYIYMYVYIWYIFVLAGIFLNWFWWRILPPTKNKNFSSFPYKTLYSTCI